MKFRHVISLVGVSMLSFVPFFTRAQDALRNPLEAAGGTDFPVIIGNVVKALLGLSGAIALLAFVWAGVLMVIGAGNPEKIKKSKSSLVWATIGLVVIFTAYTLVATLISTLSTGIGQ